MEKRSLPTCWIFCRRAELTASNLKNTAPLSASVLLDLSYTMNLRLLFAFSSAFTLWACSVPVSVDPAREANEQAVAPRIADCMRTLPSLVPGIDAKQVRQACWDKYGLHGTYVDTCYQRAVRIAASEKIAPPKDTTESYEWRRRCSDRQDFPQFKSQPYN